jgi:alpha-L-glutamate ligase-like protein
MKKFLQKILSAEEYLVGINQRNLDYVYPHNPRKYFVQANDKVLSKTILEQNQIPVPETYAIITEAWELIPALEKISKQSEFVLKPANGYGGGGILILNRKGENHWKTVSEETFDNKKLQRHMASILYGAYSIGDKDKVIIEDRLKPHSFMDSIYSDGIPDFRILLFKDMPVLAMLRVPTKKSNGKANLHQGAIGIGINLENGMLKQGFFNQKYVDRHPDSNFLFKGIEIPGWKEILNIAVETAKLFPLKFLGVDIILDKINGPVVIEINARPGLQIQNVNNTGINTVIKQKRLQL